MPILFLLSSVPGDIAGTVAAAGAGAIGVLWRRNVVLEDRQQANIEKMLEASHAVSDTIEALARRVETIQGPKDDRVA